MEQHPILATDTVVFNIRNGKLKVLLIEMNKEPFVGKWAVPGGFIGNQELSEEAAHRVLYDATNVKNLYLEQLKVFDSIERDPKTRVVSVAYMAIIKKDDISLIANKRYTGIDWFDVDHLPELAYDHQEIIDSALERLKGKITYSTISFTLVPKEFTLTELQEVFEIVLGKELDKRNFRKKILKQKVISETGNKKTIGVTRPANLYKAMKKDIKFVEMI